MLRAAILGLMVAGLAACAPMPRDGTGAPESRGFLSGLIPRGAPMRDTDAPLQRVRLARGAVVVSATNGYCIDPETLVNRGGRGFAMMASCRILSGGEDGPVVAPGLVTVTVGGPGTGAELPQPETLAAISEAPLVQRAGSEDLVLAQLGSGGQQVLEGGDARYWRGAFSQGGRLVILALYAPAGSGLAGNLGAGLLTEVHDRIKAESPGA
ncbi:dihydroxy-acid dehydratase [Thalassococcus profundi]|uniref:Dihydroxy-acid dehydratase n=1 Tax=Thalassococcus profundi TaxID=2282382 RepID=A0A369THP2_9RHOB|nr:dihydroxy-acid dehydratase [Thalassococcus profundi]RDD64144.1 dihydroxy-acid dehydratase [Thalassococcus profundi]